MILLFAIIILLASISYESFASITFPKHFEGSPIVSSARRYKDMQPKNELLNPDSASDNFKKCTNGKCVPVKDTFLRNLYHKVHQIERIARHKVAKNNDVPGGDYGVNEERLRLKSLANESNTIKKMIQEEIKESRSDPRRPKLYSNNKILGIPSHPGIIHPEIYLKLSDYGY